MRNADKVFDEWLVLKCQGGDSAALAILVERWQPRLLGFAIRLLGDRDLAEDAVQSAWLVIVKRIRSLRDPSAIRPWLFRIVANRCADSLRKQIKRRKKERAAETDHVVDADEQKQ
ncbi:MAG: sigma-70 family RNA polymerase sigma factor, partial [Planctomycetota bacterium]